MILIFNHNERSKKWKKIHENNNNKEALKFGCIVRNAFGCGIQANCLHFINILAL